MSLISDALKRAQLSKPSIENTREERITPADSILDHAIFGGTSSRGHKSIKQYAIIAILSFGLVLSLFYSYSLLQKKKSVPLPQAQITPVPLLPPVQAKRSPAIAAPEKKASEIKVAEAPVLPEKHVKISTARPAKTRPQSLPQCAVSSVSARVNAADNSLPAPVPANRSEKRLSIEEAKAAIRASLKTQNPGEDLPSAAVASAPVVAQTDKVNSAETAEKNASEFSISSIAAEKVPASNVQRSRSPQDGRIPEKEHNNLGVKCYHRGDLNGALEHFQSALKINPNNTETYVNLGIVYKRMNRLQEALKAYKQAIALKSSMPEAHYNLGILYDEQADYKRAAQAYKQFLQLAGDKYQLQKEKIEERLRAIQPE